MKRFIKFIINWVPRPLMQRLASSMVPLLGLFYLGEGKECPICGVKRRKFLPYGYLTSRENALCPSCLSLERHRLLWLYLRSEENIERERPVILHIAPEVSLMRKFDKIYSRYPARYVTADLESPLSKLHFDVQDIPLEDNYADVIICNHLLEHVEDDIKAMSELHRVLKPGGWGIMLSPVEYDRPKTFEDDSITDKKERTQIFGQYDHRRIYGIDYADRLQSVGFKVDQLHYIETLTTAERELYGVMDEIIYRVEKVI